jgi:dienelactone hydrolase
MTFAEYAFPYPEDASFFPFLSQLQNRELGTIFFFMGNSQALVQGAMDLDLMAIRDASPVPGPFPLVVYHADERSGYGQNAVLCEYLASHGFVVATTHTIGASAVNAGPQQSDLEAAIRDKELLVAVMREQPMVDTERLGLLGYDYGGSTALLHQMRNYSVDAVATLQGRFLNPGASDTLMENPSYDPLRMLVPWLQVFVDRSSDLALLDSLRYAKRYSLSTEQAQPTDFSTYGLMALVMGADTSRTIEALSRWHEAAYQYLYRFFDAYLNDNDSSLTWLENGPEANGFSLGQLALVILDPEDAPPTAVQFVNIVQTYGTERAQELCERFDLINPEHPVVTDPTFTQLGYRFLQRGVVDEALVVFRWGVTAYPKSANAWDSYGEACAANGDLAQALAHYRRAQETLPRDSAIAPQMRQILETSIPTNIQRLEEQIEAQESGSTGGSESEE